MRERSARIKPRRADKVEGVFKLLIFYLGMTETDFEMKTNNCSPLLFFAGFEGRDTEPGTRASTALP